ncbi:MAG TPA: Ig-like domain-containing protein, partial [bacterium]|nr:Ig-like domain-containing protein [bacterium]
MVRERTMLFSAVSAVLLLFFGCSSNTPNSAECITAFDCEDGYTCQNGECVALPDDVVVVDKDAAVTDETTDGAVDDVIIDEELPPDEEEADEAIDTDDDTPVVTDDPGATDEDTFLSDDDLFTDTTPPTVVENTPAADATGVGIATTVEIVFSESMNEATLTTATLILEEGDTAISGAVSYDGVTFTATFTADASLAYGTLYTFTVTTGAQDEAGNGLATDHAFSFTTAFEEVNECVTMANPCNDHGDSGGSCVDTVGAYTCICSSGFGFSGGGCKDIDECAPDGRGPCDDNGDPAATCTNTSGSYTCTCVTAGYEFKSGSCRDINECIVNSNPCDNGGDTTATCTNTPGDYTCNCSVGWHDNGTICEETNECEGDPCNDEGDLDSTCQEGVGTYTCNCSDGWNFDDGKTCKETNECVTLDDPCDDQGDTTAICNDGMATYTCTCSTHYSWNFETCAPDTKTLICSGAPANTLYYNGTSSYSYSQTWGGSDWVPPDSTATYSATPAVNTCQFKCAPNYTWNGTDTCTANTQPYPCAAKPATGTVWNTVSGYTQTWNGTAWAPADDPTTEYNTDPSDTACRYKCAADYEWSGTACINARTEACGNLPDNAVYYNDTTSYAIPQTYTDADLWQPLAIAYYDDGAPDVNTCEYKCAPNYTRHNGACVNSRTQPCDTPPSNTVYYNGSTSYSIPQTYTDGTGWQPPTTPYYNDGVPNNNTCEYKCAANYQWNGSSCINSRTQACSGLPGNATYHNGLTAYSIPQTYTDGGGWTPPATAYYDATPDNNTCGFACAATYHWDGVSACVSDTRTYTCSGAPGNTVYYNGTSSYSYAQTWSGSWS